jgi:DNA-binding response OmpR family regulator
LTAYRPDPTSMLKLKSVSGRLRQIFGSREQIAVPPEPDPGNLLVVDDEESICLSMSDYFSQHGFKVDTAHEMEEVEGLIKKTDYKALIQDLRLGMAPRFDGIDIIRLVHDQNPDTRIVVLTAFGSPEAEAEARSAGADVFLRKPKPLSQVAEVIQGLIESPRIHVVRG